MLKTLKNNRWQERLKIAVTASLDIRENVLRKMFLSSLIEFREIQFTSSRFSAGWFHVPQKIVLLLLVYQ